jgi:hypothetical protein
VPPLVKGAHLLQGGGATPVMTPKMFTHNLKAACKAAPQRIVLPEVMLRLCGVLLGLRKYGGTNCV